MNDREKWRERVNDIQAGGHDIMMMMIYIYIYISSQRLKTVGMDYLCIEK